MRKLAAAPAGIQKAIGQGSSGGKRRRKRPAAKRGKGKRKMTAKQRKYFGKRKRR